MKTTGISSLDHAPQVMAEWLNLLEDDLGWHDKPHTYMLLRETLHALRDFLSVDEAADLSAQLPILVRGIYFEGWNPSSTPAYPRNKEAFMARIAAPFKGNPPENMDAAVGAVFDLLRRKVSAGEIDQITQALRKPLRDLWH
ncbi:MAG TPA: DUF2267 domain-containing protein [Paracoccaceae bacterium]